MGTDSLDQDQPDLQLRAQRVSGDGIHWDFSKAFDNISTSILMAQTGVIWGDRDHLYQQVSLGHKDGRG